MSSNSDAQITIRRYLLGQLHGTAGEEFEKRLLTEDDLLQELVAIEDELIDEYLAASWGADEKTIFEKSFLANPERQQKLRFARALRKYSTTHPLEDSPPFAQVVRVRKRSQLFSNPYIKSAAFASLLLIAALGFWRVFFFQSDVDKGLIALNAAYHEQRPLEARLTEQVYAPFSTVRSPESSVNSVELDRAERYLLDAMRDNPDVRSYHALGKYYLAQREVDKALQHFEEGLKVNPDDVQTHADLGAAYLEKSKQEIDRTKAGETMREPALVYLGRSLKSLNRTLELNPRMLEAIFNRALCYEKMLLFPQAEDSWREYLARDSTSQWAQEARRHLTSIEEEKNRSSDAKKEPVGKFLEAYKLGDSDSAWLFVSRQRDISGGPIGNALIDEYLAASTTGQSDESLKKLSALTYLGTLERDQAGDMYILELVGFMKSASDAERKLLIEARHLMKLGRQSLFADDPENAESYYSQAKEIFDRIGDAPDSIYAEYPLGHSYLSQKKSQLGRETFERVVKNAEARNYRWLQAQSLNATANVEIGLTNYSTALDASNRSLTISKAIGDTTGEIKTTNQLAQQYFRLGNLSKSLDLHHQSLELARVATPELIQLWRNYFTVAMPLSEMGLHEAAIAYEKESLKHAQELEMPQTVCRSYSILGLMLAGQGDYDEAVKNVEMSVELAKEIPSEKVRKESKAYSALQLGLVHRRAGDFSKAIAAYDQAIQLYGELENYQPFIYVAHKGKLLSCIGLKQCPSVEEEIKTCLSLFTKFRNRILEQSNRDSFFDTEQDIYDIAIDYEFSQGHFETAFDYSEQARGRSLFDLTQDRARLVGEDQNPDLRFDAADEPRNFQQIKAEVPPEAQILQYAVLEDKLLIWLISNSDFVHEEKAISLSDLNEKVLRYLRLISSPSVNNTEAIRREGTALYETLIRPVEKSLRKDKLVCIVPDKTLSYLPFAALVSGGSGTYLVNEYQFSYASSSTMFIRSSRLAADKEDVSETLLAVGNPSFSREQFPLPDLPSAAREVREIKPYYAASGPALSGSKATEGLVKAEMERAHVIHFALHAVVDETSPMRSKLILAHNGDRAAPEDGVLHAYEIYSLELPSTRLVVLSACETGAGRYYRGEGVMGLSRPFLAAKVPLVVASLWRVDSDSTAELMTEFHKNRKTEKLSSAKALQKAQQSMANDADPHYQHPYYWAAFTAVGGYTRF